MKVTMNPDEVQIFGLHENVPSVLVCFQNEDMYGEIIGEVSVKLSERLAIGLVEELGQVIEEIRNGKKKES